MSHPFRPNPAQPRVAVENVVALTLQVGVPPIGDPDNGRCPRELRAITWPDGLRIDLVWTTPKDVTRIIIERSQLAHSAFFGDKEVIYDGPPVEHFIDGVKITETLGGPEGQQGPPFLEVGVPATGVPLEEDTYYYYTIYMTVKKGAVGRYDFGSEAQSNCQVTGLSIIDYINHPERGKWYGRWLYEMFPEKTREKDIASAAAKGRERGYFEDFCHFLQGGFNVLRGHALGLEQLADIDRTPAGLVGENFDQATILGAWARRFGIPPERFILDVEILRRIAASMVFLYKSKGTCPALVDFTKVLSRWDSECVEFDSGLGPCNPIFLKTWDDDISERRIVRQASFLTVTPGFITIPGVAFTVDEHVNSLVVGSLWDQFQVKANTPDTLELEDPTAELRVEDLITIDSVTPVAGTIYDLEVTRTDGGPAELNDSEYNGLRIIDSANVIMDVVSTTWGSPSTVQVDAGSAPSTGDAAVATNFIAGVDFASRDPVVALRVFTGCPTFLYDPLMDVDLRDVQNVEDLNPHDILYSGGSLIGVPFVPGDTILNIQSGVAEFAGPATGVASNVLTDDNADFGPDDSLLFHFLNPNLNQKRGFRIVANTKTTITVDSDIPGVLLDSISAKGSRYAVLNFKNFRFYQLLNRLLELMIPVTSRLFIFFDD
jgi:hypothetical protein